MFWAVDAEASVNRSLDPEGMSVASSMRRIVTERGFAVKLGVGTPPSLTTISLPSGVSADRTATRWGQPAVEESETRTEGEPNVSRRRFGSVTVRTAFPLAAIARRPVSRKLSTFDFGKPA